MIRSNEIVIYYQSLNLKNKTNPFSEWERWMRKLFSTSRFTIELLYEEFNESFIYRQIQIHNTKVRSSCKEGTKWFCCSGHTGCDDVNIFTFCISLYLKTMFWYIFTQKLVLKKTRQWQTECFQYFYDVSDDFDLNSKYECFKVKYGVSEFDNQAKRVNKRKRHGKIQTNADTEHRDPCIYLNTKHRLLF